LSNAALAWPQNGHVTADAGGASRGPAGTVKGSRLVTGEYALVLIPGTGLDPWALALKAF